MQIAHSIAGIVIARDEPALYMLTTGSYLYQLVRFRRVNLTHFTHANAIEQLDGDGGHSLFLAVARIFGIGLVYGLDNSVKSRHGSLPRERFRYILDHFSQIGQCRNSMEIT